MAGWRWWVRRGALGAAAAGLLACAAVAVVQSRVSLRSSAAELEGGVGVRTVIANEVKSVLQHAQGVCLSPCVGGGVLRLFEGRGGWGGVLQSLRYECTQSRASVLRLSYTTQAALPLTHTQQTHTRTAPHNNTQARMQHTIVWSCEVVSCCHTPTPTPARRKHHKHHEADGNSTTIRP